MFIYAFSTSRSPSAYSIVNRRTVLGGGRGAGINVRVAHRFIWTHVSSIDSRQLSTYLAPHVSTEDCCDSSLYIQDPYTIIFVLLLHPLIYKVLGLVSYRLQQYAGKMKRMGL